jgi:hypothetical protein
MLARLTVLVAFAFVFGCNSATDRPKQPATDHKPKDAKAKPMDRPFMQHPSGEFDTAVDAMADAIKRLRALPEWEKWITFNAQGMGARVSSYHFSAIRMRQGEISFEKPLDVDIQKVTKQQAFPYPAFQKRKADIRLRQQRRFRPLGSWT